MSALKAMTTNSTQTTNEQNKIRMESRICSAANTTLCSIPFFFFYIYFNVFAIDTLHFTIQTLFTLRYVHIKKHYFNLWTFMSYIKCNRSTRQRNIGNEQRMGRKEKLREAEEIYLFISINIWLEVHMRYPRSFSLWNSNAQIPLVHLRLYFDST